MGEQRLAEDDRFDDPPVGIAMCDLTGRFVRVNRPLCEILARSEAELVGSDYGDVVHPDDRAAEHAALAAVLQGTEPRYRIEERFFRPDGEVRSVVVTASTAAGVAGAPGIVVVRRVLDITDRRRAEAERDRFFGLSLAGIAVTGFDGVYQRVNPAYCAALGWSEAELLGRRFVEFLHPDDVPAALEEVAKLEQGNDSFGYEGRLRAKDGSYRWFRAWATAGLDEGLIYSWSIDITERKRAEAALQESEERFRRVFEEGPVGAAMVDSSWRILRVNTAFARLLGHDSDLLAETLAEVTHPDDRDLDSTLARRVFAGEIPSYEIEKRFLRDGDVIWGRVRASVVRGSEGEALYGLWLVDDISEAREAEAGRELDALKDGFLRVVSHDLQNPLVTIAGLADLVARGQCRPEEEQGLLHRIATQAARLHRMVATFLDVDRLYQAGVRAVRRPTEVAALIGRVVERVEGEGHPVTVEAGRLVVAVDPDQIEHIVENLLDNAYSHTPAGTPVWIRAGEWDDGHRLEVDDAGPGVADDDKKTIFELFRTGSKVTRRTGVGLWVVARFAGLHGGRAWVEDRPDGGAAFRVFLPTGVDAPDVDPFRGELRPEA